MNHKYLLFILTIFGVLTLMFSFDKVSAKTIIKTGYCGTTENGLDGTNIKYELVDPDDDGKQYTLNLYGTGKNEQYQMDWDTSIPGYRVNAPYSKEDGKYYNITKINIGEGITHVSYGSFCGIEVKSLKLPKSLQYIDSWAFNGNNLKNITIPDKVKKIGEYAFYKLGDSVNNVTIGKNVSSIGYLAIPGIQKQLVIRSTKLSKKRISTIDNRGGLELRGYKMTVKVPKKKYSSYKKMLNKMNSNIKSQKIKFKKI